MFKNKRFAAVMGVILVVAIILTACAPKATPTPEIKPTPKPTEPPPPPPKLTVSILGVWSGDEEAKFKEIFKPVLEANNIEIAYEGTRDLEAVLATRVEGGNPPDIAFMPNPGSLAKYADKLVALDQVSADASNYLPSWKALGTVGGKWVGLFVKSDIKSVMWYSPPVFAAKGYEVPTSWEDLISLVDQMAADGNVPLSMGMESGAATGWTGSDFIQDLRLRTAGLDFENKLAAGQAKWNDPLAKEAWELYGKWGMDDTYALGGAAGTVSTGFLDAIYAPFADPPQAMMVKQSGFAGGVVEGQYTDLIFPDDYDFFALPGVGGDAAPMQVGGDALAVFNDTPAVNAIVAYLTSAEGGKAWAASGFDLSPNNKVTGADYTNPISAKKADALAAAPAVSFDTGDLLPGGMGMDEFQGITEYINGGDLDTVLARLEARATEVFAAKAGKQAINILGVWSGAEEAKFKEIFKPVLEANNIEIAYEGTRDLEAVLATRVEGGNPPDIAFMPNPGSLAKYADKLVALDQVSADASNYLPSWKALGTVGGKWVGLFVKSDIKSVMWYSPPVFAAKGYEVPTSWEDLISLVDQMAADGNVPLSMGMESGAATGWTGSDFIQDLRLRTAGLDFENKLAKHEAQWNDPLAKEAWELYGKWGMDDTYALGGAAGTVSTGFLDAIYAPFADPAQAMMVKQSGFAGGVVQGQYADLLFPDDYDFFALPGVGGEAAPMQVGGDALAVFNDTPAVKAIVAYLTSAEGGKAWAASGFDLSPNNKVTGADYTDPISAKKADALAAAPAVSFDTGDLLPGGMGMDEFQGITEYINGGDLDTVLARLEARATEVFAAKAGKQAINILGVWSGAEEAKFKEIFKPVLEANNIEIAYEGTRDLEAVLATRVEGGNPPDIAFMPNPGSLAKYADKLIPLDQVDADASNYLPSWKALGTVDGKWVGLFVKSDIKSVMWYSPPVFAAKGYEVPTSWEDLISLVDQMAADGNVPLSMGMESGAATGWTGSDFIQDLRLRTAGLDFENKLAKHEAQWNDPLAKEAWELYGKWGMDDTYALGGAAGTVSTGFLDAIYAPFADPPQAMMVKQSGFAGGVVEGQYTDLIFPDDYDFFALPGVGGDAAPMQVGGDALAVFNDTPAVNAIVAYLTSAEGGKAWAASGFDLSPNNKVTGADYTNPISAKKADALAAAPAVSFDTGDLLPGGMGMDEFQGITEYINGGDLDAILARLEAKAKEVY